MTSRMIKQRIMYVCSECAECCPEACGHYDRTELRVMPDGAWLCESCFDNNDDNEFLSWGHLPAPEEYGRIPASAQTSPYKCDVCRDDPYECAKTPLRHCLSEMEDKVSQQRSSAETREVDTFHSDKCPTCLGDGYIGQHANSPDVKCPNCSGTGFVDTGPNVELLIENLVQAAAEYENNCDRLVAKKIRVELERAKQAIRDAITTQPQAFARKLWGTADGAAERQVRA